MNFHHTPRALALSLALPLLSLPSLSHATNGYFAHGVGVRSQGVAGTAIALPQDGLAAAANPAGTALVGHRLDIGMNWFKPSRSARISGNGAAPDEHFDGDGREHFFIPELGYVRPLTDDLAVGVAVYGNGGMNTDYRRNPFARFGSQGAAGVDLAQAFITPSIAWKPHARHAVGAAVTFAYQRFAVKGLSAFDNGFFSSAPGSVTDRGHDTLTAWGLKLGWIGQVTDSVALGLTWSSKLKADRFERYEGLFAERGAFDIPESYGAGVAWKVTPALTLASDWQRIEYSGVRSVGRTLSPLLAGKPLGAADGPGFGWRDVSVLKFGALYDYSPSLTLRGGFSRTQQPIPADQTFLNIIAPGVVRNHWTLGATWRTEAGGEWSMSYIHAPKETVRGRNSIPGAFGAGEADISLKEDILGVAYTWKL